MRGELFLFLVVGSAMRSVVTIWVSAREHPGSALDVVGVLTSARILLLHFL